MTHHRNECEITLRGNMTIGEIEQAERMREHRKGQAAEADALHLLDLFGPMPRWQITRLVMDRGHKASVADRAVKLLIISRKIDYDLRSRECRLPSQPRGIVSKLARWLR